jgi:7-cyano-7-deazaguanine synthase
MSSATGICIAIDGSYVAAAPHNGDAAIYPDCRPVFWHELTKAILVGNEGFLHENWHLNLPFLNMSKTEIAEVAKSLQVPVENTWSCYEGNDVHCGRCGTCVERLEALHNAGIEDLTVYADSEFWKTQVGIQ